jgi:para-nitrobenzyl esterase
MRAICLILLAGCGVGSEEESAIEAGLATNVVSTRSGPVRGVVETGARVFRGIPFAVPPLGALRWTRPVAPPPSATVIDASTFKPDCINFAGFGSEDCLYLNVYAPLTGTNLPVMVWVHGGGNVAGSHNREAQALAARGVIVVELPYRLGVLGFLAHPELSYEQSGSSGNYALYDLLLGLEWVRASIPHFGGDPTKIMLFGQSAGANDVEALITAPLAKGLFTRAGMESDMLDPGQLFPLAWAEKQGTQLATSLGCGGTPNQQLLCLRNYPIAPLVKAQNVAFDPIIDGHLLPHDPGTMISMYGPPVPLLIGSTRDEASEQHDPSQPLSVSAYVPTVEAEFPQLKGLVPQLYPIGAYGSPLKALIAVESDAITCDVRKVLPGTQPVFRYLWTHTLENGTPQSDFLGAYHTQESSFVFGEFNEGQAAGHVMTNAEKALSATVQGYWTRFAANGNPNGAGPGWPAWQGNSTGKIMYLDDVPVAGGDWHVPQCNVLYP